jgi:hypothetical protein
VGFLKADAARREVRFEGGLQRWVLPAASITGVTVEDYAEGPVDANQFQVHSAVVLAATVAGEPWEGPVVIGQLEFGRWAGPRRRSEAEALAERIRAAVGLPVTPADG